MTVLKRAAVITLCFAISALIMSAVLSDEPQSVSVFSQNGAALTVFDAQTLLPIEGCDIAVINEQLSFVTDLQGQALLPAKRLCVAVYKQGYAPHLLLWHDFSSGGCRVLLERSTLADVTAEVDADYARELIDRFRPR